MSFQPAQPTEKNPMELKVVCYCGQKYKFDVEPVEGRMPFTVNCPVCNVDGTPLANQLLREGSSGHASATFLVMTPPLAAPIAPPIVPATPVPMMVPPVPPAPVIAPKTTPIV